MTFAHGLTRMLGGSPCIVKLAIVTVMSLIIWTFMLPLLQSKMHYALLSYIELRKYIVHLKSVSMRGFKKFKA